MTKFRPAVMTDAGQSLATQAESGQIQLTFTKGVLSSDDLTQLGQTAVQQTTALNPFITTTINKSNIISANKIALPLNFSNEQLTEDNYAKTVGVYASDGTTEYLYAICINDAPLLISAYNGVTPEALEIEFRTEVGRASTVNVTVSPLDTVNRDQLSAVATSAQSYASVIASSVVVNTSAIATHSSAIGALQGSVASISNAVASNSTINSEFSVTNSNIATNSGNLVNVSSSVASLSTELSSVDNSVIEQNKINTGDDLNAYTVPGTYWCNFFVPTNSPSQFSNNIYPRFKLVVTGPASGGGVAHQTLYLIDGAGTQDLPSLYVRSTYKGNNWGSWQAITDESTVNSAISSLQNSVNNVYQNAVNTAKSYSDNKPSVTIAINEADAISQAKLSTSTGLFLYPNADDRSKLQSYKHVLGIYSYGLGNVPSNVSIDVNNPNTSLFTFNGVYGVYNTSTQTVSLHGTVTINKTLTTTTQFLLFNISSINMNLISNSWLNNQMMAVDTDFNRANVTATTSATGGTINLESCTINLGYDNTLGSKIPANTTTLTNGQDLYSVPVPTTGSIYYYYAPAGINVVNSIWSDGSKFQQEGYIVAVGLSYFDRVMYIYRAITADENSVYGYQTYGGDERYMGDNGNAFTGNRWYKDSKYTDIAYDEFPVSALPNWF